MKDRCAAAGPKPERDRLIRDLDRLQSGDIAQDDRTITARMPVTGDVGPVFRAVGALQRESPARSRLSRSWYA